jgi:hypothetical protein
MISVPTDQARFLPLLRLPSSRRNAFGANRPHVPPGLKHVLSRSELDWAEVGSALSAEMSWREVRDALVRTRGDKPNPHYYATLTVVRPGDLAEVDFFEVRRDLLGQFWQQHTRLLPFWIGPSTSDPVP